MKGAMNQTIGIMILLVLGVVVLMVVSTMILSSIGTTSDLQLQNSLTSCCTKFLPECTNLNIACYRNEANEDISIQELAGKLGVDPKEFCGCN